MNTLPNVVWAGPGQDLLSRRLLARVAHVTSSGCWLVDGTRVNGYGKIHVAGRRTYAHRAAHMAWIGPIPEGCEVDHRCHNSDPDCPGGNGCWHRSCINPAHLEAVVHRTNMLRGKTPSSENHRKVACKYGHAFSGVNLIVRRGRHGQTWRVCRICRDRRNAQRVWS